MGLRNSSDGGCETARDVVMCNDVNLGLIDRLLSLKVLPTNRSVCFAALSETNGPAMRLRCSGSKLRTPCRTIVSVGEQFVAIQRNEGNRE